MRYESRDLHDSHPRPATRDPQPATRNPHHHSFPSAPRQAKWPSAAPMLQLLPPCLAANEMPRREVRVRVRAAASLLGIAPGDGGDLAATTLDGIRVRIVLARYSTGFEPLWQRWQ
ncbi:hypothetical protein CSOJ01_05722 [Colletotrichum sojae]|uniref:Uncharacterized protein n=1 Tax=Colletotrichum sojae TaxID=2175907 RepID=A0A8H6MX26_9PEZI|nr:hypothetical protein CSOJ01_05722 [Colletotrichum sojae]